MRADAVTALLAAVWLLLDYPWGLLAFVAIAAPRAALSHGGDSRSHFCPRQSVCAAQCLYLEAKNRHDLSELRIFDF